MKLLVMCEGPNEKRMMDILLQNDCLVFNKEDLLDDIIFHARQINTNSQVKVALNLYPGEVKVFRIGDKQSDKLKIPENYKNKIVSVEKYCTKPELEMLLIISTGLVSEYEKVKSVLSAKEFAKNNIMYGKRHYDNSTDFYSDYFSGNVDMLVFAIKEYQRIHGKSHGKDEHCLAELLK